MSSQADTYSVADGQLLNSLASIHLVFGMHESALRFLELSNWILHSNPETLRLLAQAAFNMRMSAYVIEVLDELAVLSPGGQLSEEELMLKGRSLALLGETGEARAVLFGQSHGS